MVYRATDEHDNIIASYNRMIVGFAGELECRKEFGGKVQIVFAPGQWKNFFWDEYDE